MFTRFSLNPAKNALAYRTTSNMTSDFPCIPHPFTRIDRTIDAKAENGAGAARLRGKLAGMTTGAARREGARTAPSKQAFETRIKRRRPACAAIPSRKRSPLAQKSAAKTNDGKRNRFSEQTRGIQKPTSGKPLHIDCVSGTPENWRVRRGSANARLGHAYPWYATYSSHIPASLRTFPQRKPPQRRPTDNARRHHHRSSNSRER